MVDDGRGDGMNGGDLRAVKGESASVGDGAWVGGDGWLKSELRWGRRWIGAWVRVENAGIEEKTEWEKIYIILTREIIKYIIWF